MSKFQELRDALEQLQMADDLQRCYANQADITIVTCDASFDDALDLLNSIEAEHKRILG